MYRFFVKPESVGEETIVISGKDVNHIKNVLRMKRGEEILVSDGVNRDYHCRIVAVDDSAVEAEIIDVDGAKTELPAKIFLFQGLPKSDKMEWIIQKAVELGVFEIFPVSTKRTIVKLDKKKEETKLKRWNMISESAAKQSKRIIIPKVNSVISFSRAVKEAADFDVLLIPYENAFNMAETKKEIEKIRPGQKVGVFIGPEGGFCQSEIDLAMEAGVKPVTLGKRILRTETAGMMMLSVMMFHLEDYIEE